MNNNDVTRRRAFEKWADDHNYDLTVICDPVSSKTSYYSSYTTSAWSAWEAAMILKRFCNSCSKPDDFVGTQEDWEAHCSYTDSLCETPRSSGSTDPQLDACLEKTTVLKGATSEHD